MAGGGLRDEPCGGRLHQVLHVHETVRVAVRFAGGCRVRLAVVINQGDRGDLRDIVDVGDIVDLDIERVLDEGRTVLRYRHARIP